MDKANSCTNCGANLGPADLDKPACPYCGTAHPHIAKARQQVEALRQVYAMGGMPGMAAPAVAPSPWLQQGAPGQPQQGVAFFPAGLPPPPPPSLRRSTLPMIITVVMIAMFIGALAIAGSVIAMMTVR